MTPHPRCRLWFHAIKLVCVECELMRAHDEIVDADISHRDFMRIHFPESYRRFNRPALKVVRGGE